MLFCDYRIGIVNILILTLGLRVAQSLTGEEAVKRFFEYFRADDPHGIPVANFGEPMEIYSPLELVPVTVTNGKVLGHSQIKFIQVFIDFNTLTGLAKISCPRMEMFGNYSWPGIYFNSEGFMNTTLYGVSVDSNFTLTIDQTNTLQMVDIKIHEESEDVHLNFTNLIWEHEMILSSGAVHVFFDEIALEIFRQLQPFLMSEVNREMVKFMATLPPVESFLPPDSNLGDLTGVERENKMMSLLLNRLIHYLGMDPLQLPDQSKKMLKVEFKVTNLMIVGTSTIYKINTLFVVYQEKKMHIEASMRYSRLLLFYYVAMDGGPFSKLDVFEKHQLNDVDFNIKLIFDPSLRTPPKIIHLDINVGSFGKIRTGRKNFWGKVMNVLKNWKDAIRNQVINAVQGPIKKILQKQLNTIDIEQGLLDLLNKK